MELLDITLEAYEVVSGQLGYEAGLAREEDLPRVNADDGGQKARIARERGARGAPAPGGGAGGAPLPPGFVPE